MKKVLVMALFALVVLASCSKDEDEPKQDCFDCTTQSITVTYCHTDGDTFYTATTAGQDIKQELGAISWEDYKTSVQASGACN